MTSCAMRLVMFIYGLFLSSSIILIATSAILFAMEAWFCVSITVITPSRLASFTTSTISGVLPDKVMRNRTSFSLALDSRVLHRYLFCVKNAFTFTLWSFWANSSPTLAESQKLHRVNVNALFTQNKYHSHSLCGASGRIHPLRWRNPRPQI